MTVYAYNYARFSTRKQEDGRSLERQTESFRDACERNGWVQAEQMVDAGVPGSSGQNMREGMKLTRWVAKVKRGELRGAVLVIEDFDRLSRDFATKAMRTVLDLLDGGITIFTVRDGRNGTAWTADSVDSNSGVMTQIADKISAANGYSVRLSWRLLDAWKSKRRKLKDQMDSGGIHQAMTKLVPHWLGVDVNRKFFVKERETALVRQMFHYYSTGYGTTQIAREYNSQGLVRVSGEPWSDTAILNVIRNRATIGELSHPTVEGGIKTVGYYPAIIDEALFNKCQTIRTSRLRAPGPKTQQQNNLFSGLVYCGICNQPLRLDSDSRSSNYSRFACRREKSGSCGFKAMRYNDFETKVLDLIFNKLTNQRLPGVNPQHEQKMLERKLKGLMKQQSAIMENFRVTKKMPEILITELSKLEAEIGNTREQLKRTAPAMNHSAEWVKAKQIYNTMFLEEPRNLDFRIKLAMELKFIVEKIFIDPQIDKNRPLRINGIGWNELLEVESAPVKVRNVKRKEIK